MQVLLLNAEAKGVHESSDLLCVTLQHLCAADRCLHQEQGIQEVVSRIKTRPQSHRKTLAENCSPA